MFFGCTICFSMNFPSQIVTAEGAIGIIPGIDDEYTSVPLRLKEIKHDPTVSVMPNRESIFKSIDTSARRAYTGWFLQGRAG